MEEHWKDLLGVLVLSIVFSVRLSKDSPRNQEKLLARNRAIIELDERVKNIEQIVRSRIS
jgi:hypothetical protein